MFESFADLAVPGVRRLTPYEPGKPLEALEREYGVRDAIKLASNENPLGPSPAALEALGRAMAHLGRYPDGAGFALRQRLAAKHGVSAAAITLGNGSNDVLEMVARVFAGPGDAIVFSQYAFAIYALVARAVGAEEVVVPAMDWGHDLEAMLACASASTRVIYIANPNNPTGTLVESEQLLAFLDRVARSVIVVLDEAYFEYVGHAPENDASQWVSRYPNLVVTRTFSKAYGLAGLRVGYSVSHPDLAEPIFLF
jgi:histidinol-phosphate aminotransferase